MVVRSILQYELVEFELGVLDFTLLFLEVVPDKIFGIFYLRPDFLQDNK